MIITKSQVERLSQVAFDIRMGYTNAKWGSQEIHDILDEIIELQNDLDSLGTDDRAALIQETQMDDHIPVPAGVYTTQGGPNA